jgi:di/tricarboxylate transporter
MRQSLQDTQEKEKIDLLPCFLLYLIIPKLRCFVWTGVLGGVGLSFSSWRYSYGVQLGCKWILRANLRDCVVFSYIVIWVLSGVVGWEYWILGC